MKRLRNPRRNRFSALPSGHGLLFFAQRLEEALFDFSLDSFKVSALNTHTRCLELLRTVEEVEAGHIHAAAIRSLLEELAHSLRGDPVAKQLVGPMAADMQRATWWDANNPQRAALQVKVMLARLWRKRYEMALRAELELLVPSGQKKGRISDAIVALVVEWVNRGFARDYIFYQCKNFFFGFGQGKLTERSLSDFFALFDIEERSFDVVVRIERGWHPAGTLLRAEIAELHKAAPPIRKGMSLEKAFLSVETAGFLVLKGIDAPEPRAAVHEAVGRLRTLHAALLLNRHGEEAGWEPEYLVYDGDHPVVLKASRNPMHHEEECGDEELAERVARPIRAIGRAGDEGTTTRLLASIGLHASAVRSDEASVQLLSLWSAVEALLPATKENARIVGISDRLVPALTASYPIKLLRHLLDSLSHCAPKLLAEALSRAGECGSQVEGLARIVALAQHGKMREKMLADLDDNPLLRYRLWVIAKQFESPASMLQIIEEHQTRVSWHVERIYRTRNLVVHSGLHVPYLDTLVENLHRYFHRLLAEIVDELVTTPSAVDLDSAVLSIQLRVEGHRRLLKALGSKPFESSDFLQDCIVGSGRDWSANPVLN